MANTTQRGEIVSTLRSLLVLGACVVPLACYGGLDGGSGGATSDSVGEDGDGDGGGSADDGADDGSDDGPMGACVEEAPASAPLRRLTNTEYANSIADTFGVDIAAEAIELLPPEVRTEGFSNTSNGLLVTYARVEAYRDLAKSVVAQVPNLAGEVAEATSCTDFTEACQRPLIEDFGHRLWRRPLTPAEVDSFLPIFTAALEENGAFADGAGLVLEALLQSPQFLYRIEDEWPEDGQPGDVRALTGYEVASRLSYLVWGSSPDDTLYAAAADGTLTDEAQIEEQVRRMLELPRARETSRGYVEDWLALQGLPTINRDPELYPTFTSDLAIEMREESLALADDVLWEQRAPISALLTADFTIASEALATFYGFPNPLPGVNRYELGDIEHRLGLLTQAGILAINGHGNRPSIVERGLFVLGGVMCRGVAAPPAELDTTMADVGPDASERERSDARLANATCNACHSQFDSMGYAFEPFDGVGAFREMDENGNVLRQDGWYFDGDQEEVPFQTAEEMVAGLAELDSVVECIGLRKPLQFAVGRPLGPDDACVVETLGEALDVGDGSYQDLIVAIATHPTFRVIRNGEGE